MPCHLLAHAVIARSLGSAVRVIGDEAVRDVNVKVTAVLRVGLDIELALDLLTSLDGQNVLEVEDGLLPVGVLGVGAGGEADGLVAGGEVDVEPGDEGVDEIIALGFQLEVAGEGEVGGGAGVQVKSQDQGRVSDDGLEVDGVDEGLGESSLLQGGVVEAVDVVPDCSILLDQLGSVIHLDAQKTYIQSSRPCSRHPRYRRRRWWPCQGRSGRP